MKKTVLFLICVSILSGCGLTRSDLGLEKATPDEMLVVSRAPLSIPPEFNLRPIVEIVEDDNAEFSVGEKSLLENMK